MYFKENHTSLLIMKIKQIAYYDNNDSTTYIHYMS